MSGGFKLRQRYPWWEYRSRLEKVLIFVSVIALSIVIVLLVLLVLALKKELPTSPCNIPTCLAPSPLIQNVDLEVDPCEDFYNFTCGKLFKEARGDEKLGPFFHIQNKVRRQIRELYSEPVQEHDHQTVKFSKMLYTACLNESAVQKDSVATILEVIKKSGGWPIVGGKNWDHSNFSWISTSLALRQLGYFYAGFLEVTVVPDPKFDIKFIFKISIPNADDSYEEFYVKEKQKMIQEAAVIFGANETTAQVEGGELYDFILELQEESLLRRNNDLHQRMTISQFQQLCEDLNWLEFINHIVNPGVTVFSDDYVLFPPCESVKKWLTFISQTPKRLQANYLAWKVVEDMIPYLVNMKHLNIKRKVPIDAFGIEESRSDFCIRQIRKRFQPSPIDILYLRKYIGIEKKRQVEQIISDLQIQLLKLLEESDWVNYIAREEAMEKVRKLQVIVGGPDNYHEDEIFDDLDINLNGYNTTNFLTLLSAGNINYESWKYNQIYSTEYEAKISKWTLQTLSIIGDYCRDQNIIYIPATILQDSIFDETRPTYVNYGSMGALMGPHFLQLFGESIYTIDKDSNLVENWPRSLKFFLGPKMECLEKQIQNSNATSIQMTDLLLQRNLGLKISYAAYKNRIQNIKNDRLTNYTPDSEQFFWISATSYFCQPSRSFIMNLDNFQEKEMFPFLVSEPLRNNPDFAHDFKCRENSTMNLSDKCTIF